MPKDVQDKIRKMYPELADKIIEKWYNVSELSWSRSSNAQITREIKMVAQVVQSL